MIPPLWRQQAEALVYAEGNHAALLAMEMGTGKSRVVVELVNRKRPRAVLIVCPVSVLGVWRREFAHYGTDAELLILDKGTVKQKQEEAHEFIMRPSDKPRVVVINYESAWRKPFGEWASWTIFWDLIVADESHRAKSASGRASRWLSKLSGKRKLALTGTPMPHSPLDIWAQYRFLDPTIFGRSYIAFRSRYAVINPMFPSQVKQWINQEELAAKVGSIAYQCKADVLDLPEALHETRAVTLSPATMRIYRELEREMVAEVEAGKVTAANALVKLLRLQQITSGYVQPDEGVPFILDLAKQNALEDLLEDLPTREPVVVFCRFRHDLAVVRDVGRKLDRRYGELSGEHKDGLTPQATMNPDVDLLGVQIQSGGVGIDLSRAAYAVYFSIGYSMGDYLQSLARLHRPGQRRCVRYYHLVATDTVDEKVYAALEARQNVVDYVLSQLKGDGNEDRNQRSADHARQSVGRGLGGGNRGHRTAAIGVAGVTQRDEDERGAETEGADQ